MATTKKKDGPGTPILSAEEELEIEERCTALAKKHETTKVYPVVLLKDDIKFERVIGFIKEPNYQTKVYFMQQSAKNGIWPTGAEMADMLLIKEASDPLTYGETATCDPFKLAVARRCIGLTDIMTDVWKKK